MTATQSATASTATPAIPPVDENYLLSDEEIARFIVRGYHLIDMADHADVHARSREQLSAFVNYNHPTGGSVANNTFLPIWYDPRAVGAARSILGHDCAMPVPNGQMHCHCNPPGKDSVWVHRDSGSTPADLWRTTYLICFYFPHDVPAEMGPTLVFPETHLRGGSVNFMKHYMNIRGQVPLICKAGMFAITAGNLFHGAAGNKSNQFRYMIKGHYGRRSDPAGPTWRHAPDAMPAVRGILQGDGPVPAGVHEQVQLRGARQRMWDYMNGKAVTKH